MKNINDGGPAFPCEGGDLSGLHAAPGMTLRDWFAGQALPYVTEFHGQDLYRPAGPSDIAAKVYEIADAMLAARSKP